MTSRSVLGRPRRTKVYDCNFSAGERYYRPVVDSLDRKPLGGVSSPSPEPSGLSSLRSRLLAETPERTIRRRTPRLEETNDYEEPRPKVNSALLDEYDSIYENRNRTIKEGRSTRDNRTPNRVLRELEDEADKEIASYLNRIQKNRAAKTTLEDEFESEVTPRYSKRREPIDFQEKLLDTVGIKNSSAEKAIQSLENDSFFKKRTLRVTSEEDGEAPSFTKWTALKSRDGDMDDFESAASARARKTRNRLQDIESEIEELTNKSAAREKRVAQLRALVKENEANAASESSHSSLKVSQKSSVRSEKKTVTF